MNDECDCGWCGQCADQLEHERRIRNMRGYGIPSYEDDEIEDEMLRQYEQERNPDKWYL